jgi:hypothetical protein
MVEGMSTGLGVFAHGDDMGAGDSSERGGLALSQGVPSGERQAGPIKIFSDRGETKNTNRRERCGGGAISNAFLNAPRYGSRCRSRRMRNEKLP